MNLREFINFNSPWNQPSICSDSLNIIHYFICNVFFFSSALVLLNFVTNWALIVAYVLRDTYKHQ